MRKLKVTLILLLIFGLTIFWISCNVCTITVNNQTGEIIDSVKFGMTSKSNYSFTSIAIKPNEKMVRQISKKNLQLGHYFSLSAIFYMKDTVIIGPETSTDIVYEGGKYIYTVTKDKKIILKME
jgi:hypothetical protein